ncbi:MAG: PhzF family phenazine biosynthesis isomerase [Deltaproteobacteria bacterium]|nr:PhzF family phenazine biosynthesis isomerase [Deltaproteobacteria bacterium]MDZ4347709.1 PhzF family phenazine biosynthesis isomerase [Candidatus Binatia bacterium]
MTLLFKQVDVFTQKPFQGNLVAVVIDAEALRFAAIQRIASWTNLSETAFALTPSTGRTDYRRRNFSAKKILPFTGRPTIGNAHAVIESDRVLTGGDRSVRVI